MSERHITGEPEQSRVMRASKFPLTKILIQGLNIIKIPRKFFSHGTNVLPSNNPEEPLSMGKLFDGLDPNHTWVEPSISLGTQTYQYGRMTMVYNQGESFDTIHLQLGTHVLDIPNLPDDYPGKFDTKGRPLSLRVGPLYQPEYDAKNHRLTFDDASNFASPTFPLTLFEELQHAGNHEAIDAWLRHVGEDGFSYPSFLPQLTESAFQYIRENRVAPDVNWEDLRPNDPAYFAFRLANELLTKCMVLERALDWCEGDLTKMGVTDQLVAEETLIELLDQATNVDQLRYVGGQIADLPPYKTLDDLQRMMKNRLLFLRGRLRSPESLSKYPGSQHNFFPGGTTAKLLNTVLG